MTLSKSQKRELTKIIIAAVLFVLGIIAELAKLPIVSLVLFAAAYIPVGLPVLIDSLKGIFRGNLLDENFLMAIATIGAFILGEFTEGVAVMLFYNVGELFQNIAVDRSRRSIAGLMEMCPDTARVIRGDETVTVSPDEVLIGETVIVNPGEKIPLDGVIIEGETTLNTAALTGESLPRSAAVGDTALSGVVNIDGLIRIKVTKLSEESTAQKILDMVENSSAKKSKREAFITRFARVYTPIVVVLALALAVIPSLFTGNWSHYVYQGLSFLVISCPCALVISVPLSFFGGIGAASRNGVLVKGGNYLEALANVDTVMFDKTGTLTEGSFRVTEVSPIDMTEEELLTIAAKAEAASSHPIARSILEAYGKAVDTSDVTEVTEQAGKGVICKIGGITTAVGGARLAEALGCHLDVIPDGSTVMYVLRAGKLAGTIVVADAPKAGAKEAVTALRRVGIKRCVMLTGDSEAVAGKISAQLALDGYRAELLPGDKVTEVERELEGGSVAFVGDGINDAPVLSRADVGIAMGAIGSDAAIEAADVVLMDDDPRKIAFAVKLARRTVAIATQNIVFALAVKGFIMVLGFLGLANMWFAVFADVGVAVLAILNAMRVGRR